MVKNQCPRFICRNAERNQVGKRSLVDTSFLLKASDMRKSSLNYQDIYDWKECASDGYGIVIRLFI